MSISDHLTISHSQAVKAGAQFSAITCSKCGSTVRLLLPIAASDLLEVTKLMIKLHRHREEDDE